MSLCDHGLDDGPASYWRPGRHVNGRGAWRASLCRRLPDVSCRGGARHAWGTGCGVGARRGAALASMQDRPAARSLARRQTSSPGMTLRARLALGFLAIALLLAIPLAEALYALHDARDAATRLRDQPFAASVVASRVRAVTQQFRRAEARVIVSRGDPEPAEDLARQQQALEALADSVRLIGSDVF